MGNSSTLACRAILFDLDGTLVDSTPRLRRLWKWWAQRRGISLEALIAVMHGRTAFEIIRLAAPQLDPQEEIEALETEEVSDMYDVQAYPAALRLLESLPGASWAIVTSGSRRVAEARINHTRLPLPAILVTADLVSSGKPAPDCYLVAARQLGFQPEDCVAVEDSPVGIEAAKAAGMRVVAIASTHTAGELQAADAVIGRLADIDIDVTSGGLVMHLRT